MTSPRWAFGPRICKTVLVAALAGLLGACSSPPADDALRMADLQRGELLYEAKCSACHTTQAHWREQRLVKTWPDLLEQVERWQGVAHAGWTPADVRDVASYLNRVYYHLPCDACGAAQASASP